MHFIFSREIFLCQGGRILCDYAGQDQGEDQAGGAWANMDDAHVYC